MKSVFDSVSSATGLDLAAIIQGQAVGRGIGESLANAQTANTPAPAATAPETPRTRAAAKDAGVQDAGDEAAAAGE
ncbi:hypothetical protein [Microbacterium tenebrionis]|nr:hypothetical protein [Microbacterium ihumii]